MNICINHKYVFFKITNAYQEKYTFRLVKNKYVLLKIHMYTGMNMCIIHKYI